ncbi:peptidoglycan-binding protein, partial [Patescibacteria group bacterium]|nr:peptidoglycan-binding protein [Patescibacteria group bacterium]
MQKTLRIFLLSFSLLLLSLVFITGSAKALSSVPPPADDDTTTPGTGSNPVSTKFAIGDKVFVVGVSDSLLVRSSGSATATAFANVPKATKGTVIDGPVSDGGYVWWKISYANGITGWSAEGSADGTKDYLAKDNTTTVTPTANTVDLKAGINGTAYANYGVGNPLALAYQQNLWLTWTASQDGPLTCSLNAPGAGTVQRVGTLTYFYNQSTFPKVTTTYTITCGNATDSVTVTPPGAPAAINVDFTVNGKHGTATDPVVVPVGQDMLFKWSADPVATSCNIEPQPGGVAGSSGSATMKNNSVLYPYFEQYMSRTYVITCTDGGTKSGTAKVTVVPTGISVDNNPTTVDLQASLDRGKTWKDAPAGTPLVADADQRLWMRWKTTNTRACSFGEPLAHYNNNVWPWPREYYQLNPLWDTNPTNNLLGYIQWWANDDTSYPPRGKTVTYTLTCEGGILPDGTVSPSASDSVTIKNDPPAVSKVELKVNGSGGSNPTSAGMTAVNFKYGDPVTLSWNIVGGTDCYFFRDATANDLSSYLSKGNSSSVTLKPGDLGYPPNGGSYTLSCTVAAGTGAPDAGPGYEPRISRSSWIVLTDPSVPTPSVTLRLNGQANNITLPSGKNLELTWSSDNVDSCDLYLGNTLEPTQKNVGIEVSSPYVIKSGDSNYPNISKYTSYSIRCKYTSGGGGTVQGFAQAILGAATSTPTPTDPTKGTNPTNPDSGTVPTPGTGDRPSTGCIELHTTLQLGSSGADVISLQQFLVSKSYLTVPSGVDMGYFGALTKSAVIAFQKANGTSADGVVGPLTRGKIQVLTCTDGTGVNDNGGSNSDSSGGNDSGSNNNSGSNSSAVRLQANHTDNNVNVTAGSSVILSWTTTGQTSCYKSSTPASEFTGVLLPVASGSITVYPTSSITYTITCGTLTSSVNVNGGAQNNTGSNSGGNFSIGDTVSATTLLNVRSEPSINSSVISTVSSGSQGSVIAGPTTDRGYTWWKINFGTVTG